MGASRHDPHAHAPAAPPVAALCTISATEPTSSAPSISGDELIRRTLEDLVIAHERDPSHRRGVSRASLAAHLGCSRQRVDAILDATKPNINLRAGQIERLPPRARRAVMAVLTARSRAADARTATKHATPEADEAARHRRAMRLLGELAELFERALANDGHVDPTERAELRAAWAALAAESTDGAVAPHQHDHDEEHDDEAEG